MDHKQKKRVPVSEKDKTKPYYRFFEREMTPPDPASVAKVKSGPIDPKDALTLEEVNRLFEPGYMKEEIGYCIMEDGTGYMASRVPMPGVTADMFDWWFAWHGLDNLRYKIWDNEDHYRAECQDPDISSNRALSFKERYVDTVHYIEEDLGAGVEKAYLHFMRPADFGFDESKIGTDACASIACTRSFMRGKPGKSDPAHCMIHFLRENDGVMELRSRSWLGKSFKDGQVVRTIPEGVRLPEIAPKMLLLHCMKEFSNLAAILPEVFAQEHDEL